MHKLHFRQWSNSLCSRAFTAWKRHWFMWLVSYVLYQMINANLACQTISKSFPCLWNNTYCVLLLRNWPFDSLQQTVLYIAYCRVLFETPRQFMQAICFEELFLRLPALCYGFPEYLHVVPQIEKFWNADFHPSTTMNKLAKFVCCDCYVHISYRVKFMWIHPVFGAIKEASARSTLPFVKWNFFAKKYRLCWTQVGMSSFKYCKNAFSEFAWILKSSMHGIVSSLMCSKNCEMGSWKCADVLLYPVILL